MSFNDLANNDSMIKKNSLSEVTVRTWMRKKVYELRSVGFWKK